MAPTADTQAQQNGSKVSSVPLIIDGKDVTSEDLFEVVSPADGKVVYRGTNATVSHAKAAIEAAKNAFKSWSETTPQQRRDVFLAAASILEKRQSELAKYVQEETGADEGWGMFNVILAKECILSCASLVSTLEGKIPVLQDPSVGGFVLKEPYGVVYAMAPWNAPYALGFRAVCWPIAAGNTVVFKGSELSPRCLWAVCSVLQEAGLPSGVVNFITSEPSRAAEIASTIIEDPTIKKINFTGSTAVGRILAKLAGANLKPILLELGGKAPSIVCEDADLDVAATQCVHGAFMHAGQVCMSTERILVHKNVRQEFEEKFKKAVEETYSSQKNTPILIVEGGVQKNRALVKDAVDKGAKLIYGDLDATHSLKTALAPIVLGDVTPEMNIYKTESFGPTVSIIEFEDEKEALRIANDTEYGLSSSLFSRDLRRALRMAKEIETGAVHINRMTIHDEAALPHGGAKASGFGRFNASLDEWLRTKNITYDL